MSGGKKTRLATAVVCIYVAVTVASMGWLYSSWQLSDSAPMAGMAHALTAMFLAAVGLAATIVVFASFFFVTHGLRHYLASMAVLCIWLAVMGAVFQEEIRYTVNPGSFRSYNIDVHNDSEELIEGNVVGVAENQEVVFIDHFRKSKEKGEHYGGIGVSTQPPEKMPTTIVITWWKGWTMPPVDSGKIIETRIAWPSTFEDNQTVVIVYNGDGRWSARTRGRRLIE